MKLVVKYNLWKYAENEKMSQPENKILFYTEFFKTKAQPKN